jgi:KUP system potassium uptake protein
VIASQAVISGVFDHPAGDPARLRAAHGMQHTSGSQIGQIYLPGVNWLMLLGVIALVLAFGHRPTWRRPTASRSPAP